MNNLYCLFCDCNYPDTLMGTWSHFHKGDQHRNNQVSMMGQRFKHPSRLRNYSLYCKDYSGDECLYLLTEFNDNGVACYACELGFVSTHRRYINGLGKDSWPDKEPLPMKPISCIRS